jgi:hypothetical protein
VFNQPRQKKLLYFPTVSQFQLYRSWVKEKKQSKASSAKASDQLKSITARGVGFDRSSCGVQIQLVQLRPVTN